MGEMKNVYIILVGGLERKRSLEGPRGRWEEGVDSIHLAQHRDQWRALVNTIINLRVI
jgi:hypothetical protein